MLHSNDFTGTHSELVTFVIRAIQLRTTITTNFLLLCTVKNCCDTVKTCPSSILFQKVNFTFLFSSDESRTTLIPGSLQH